MTRTTGGFTLIELMIVTALIGIIAGIAVPNLVASRSVANERAMIATLRTVSTAEVQVMTLRTLDTDRDGAGEALSLLELAGSIDMRGTTVRLAPTALSKSLGTLHPSGFVISKGYLLGFYLPDASGVGVLCNPANLGSVDTNLSEQAWSCVAWPLNRGSTGQATYFDG